MRLSCPVPDNSFMRERREQPWAVAPETTMRSQNREDSEPKAHALVNRRGHRAIVRAAAPAAKRDTSTQLPPGVARDRRRRIPTLAGLGDELPRDTMPDCRRWMPTIPGLGDELPAAAAPDRSPSAPTVGRLRRQQRSGVTLRDREPSASASREEATQPTPRPAVLRPGIDDELARTYRREANRILASGVFPVEHPGDPAARQQETAVAGRSPA